MSGVAGGQASAAGRLSPASVERIRGVWRTLLGAPSVFHEAGCAVAARGAAAADAFAWLVVLLGVAGAVALFVQVQGVQFMPGRDKAFDPDQDMVPLIWTSAVALVVPAVAAVAVPRQFGVAVLAGWIGIGVTVVADKTGFQGSLFGYTLLALVAAIIPFARSAPSPQVERARPG